jgi:hypothetical protein
MSVDGEAPAPGYYAYGTTEGEGDRNDQKAQQAKRLSRTTHLE